MLSYKKTFGTEGEKLARRYLRQKGYCFVSKNYATARGELDLVCLDANDLVFVEVKTMTEKGEAYYGRGALKLTREKIAHLSRAARAFCEAYPELCRGRDLRFDVVEVTLTAKDARFSHLKNAFPVAYGYSRKKFF